MGFALDAEHDACMACFTDEALGIDDANLRRALVRTRDRREAVSRLLELMLYESSEFADLSGEEAVLHVLHERGELRRRLVEADADTHRDAVDDAIKIVSPLVWRGKLTGGAAIGDFVKRLAASLAAEPDYATDQSPLLRRTGLRGQL